MAYNFGQLRRSQISDYLTPMNFTIITIEEESPFSTSGSVHFMSKAINVPGKLYSTTTTGAQRCYYLKFRIYMRTDSEQYITVRLKNTAAAATDNATQTLKVFHVDKGLETDYMNFNLVIAPNGTYDQIEFLLDRVAIDMEIVNPDGSYGRIINLDNVHLYEIYNVITYLNPSINNSNRLKQIGVQSRPGFQMCIDGESILVGRTGIYEINQGVNIKFIGFIITENDQNEYFILDYQY